MADIYARSVSGYGTRVASADTKCGLLFYQAGVAVLTSSLFMGNVQNGMLDATGDAEFGNNSGRSITGSILYDGIRKTKAKTGVIVRVRVFSLLAVPKQQKGRIYV